MQEQYLSTSKMAKFIGYSADFLRKNMHKTFTEGIHFFKPSGQREYRWSVSKMQEWVRGETMSQTSKDVLSRIL